MEDLGKTWTGERLSQLQAHCGRHDAAPRVVLPCLLTLARALNTVTVEFEAAWATSIAIYWRPAVFAVSESPNQGLR